MRGCGRWLGNPGQSRRGGARLVGLGAWSRGCGSELRAGAGELALRHQNLRGGKLGGTLQGVARLRPQRLRKHGCLHLPRRHLLRLLRLLCVTLQLPV
eukprot:8171466-Pyramimonas_sp.AAC.1